MRFLLIAIICSFTSQLVHAQNTEFSAGNPPKLPSVADIFKDIPNCSIMAVDEKSNSPFAFSIANESNKDLIIGVFDQSKVITPSGSDEFSLPASDMFNPESLGETVVKEGVAYVRYNLENGKLVKGDLLTVSSEPGVGMRATQNGFTVGVALEDSDSTEKEGLIKIRVMVRYEKM